MNRLLSRPFMTNAPKNLDSCAINLPTNASQPRTPSLSILLRRVVIVFSTFLRRYLKSNRRALANLPVLRLVGGVVLRYDVENLARLPGDQRKEPEELLKADNVSEEKHWKAEEKIGLGSDS